MSQRCCFWSSRQGCVNSVSCLVVPYREVMNNTRATKTYNAFLWFRQSTCRQPYDAHFEGKRDVISTVYFSDVNDLSFDVLTQKSLNCVLKILTLYLTRRQNADLRFINAIHLRLINFKTCSRCCLVRRMAFIFTYV